MPLIEVYRRADKPNQSMQRTILAVSVRFLSVRAVEG